MFLVALTLNPAFSVDTRFRGIDSIAIHAQAAFAQAPVTDSLTVITGRVLSSEGQPIVGAIVTIASTAARATSVSRSDSSGRFRVSVLKDIDRYFISVDAAGRTRLQLVRSSSKDARVELGDLVMTGGPQMLAPLRVRARRTRPELFGTQAPGGVQEFFPTEYVDQLVADRQSLDALSLLVPGATVLSRDDGSPAFSIAGSTPSQNGGTIDGATNVGTRVPRDAISASSIITATSDVSQGRFSGGLISARTVQGSEARRNVLRVWGTHPLVQSSADQTSGHSEYREIRLSESSSGRLAKLPIYYATVIEMGRRTHALASYLTSSRDRLESIGLPPDSIARLSEIAERLGLRLPALDIDRRVAEDALGFVSFSVRRSPNSEFHARINGFSASQHPTFQPFVASLLSGQREKASGGDLHLSLSSQIFGRVLNTFRSTMSTSTERGSPLFRGFPEVVIAVGDDEGTGGPALGIGGGGATVQRQHRRSWEIGNEMALDVKEGQHRAKAGAMVRFERLGRETGGDDLGAYFFSSLGTLEVGLPASFARTFGQERQTATTLNGSIYAGDRWRLPSGRTELQYGVRIEADRHMTPTAFSPEIASLFGLRTDREPVEVRLSPRVGLTWRYGRGPAGRPFGEFRFGIGEYRGTIPLGSFIDAANVNDSATRPRELICIGPEAPAFTLSFPAPHQCRVTSAGIIGPTPTTTAFAQGFRAPRSWRATSSVSGSVGDGVVVRLESLYSRGLSQPSRLDLNLRSSPAFTLSSEAGRPVYASVGSFVRQGAVPSVSSGRRESAYGAVWKYVSDAESEATQFTFRVSFPPGWTLPGTWQIAYTWSKIHDDTRGYGHDTDGDPRAIARARSRLERRHQFLVTGKLPDNNWFTAYAVARLTSGLPYSPLISADINGDGATNDRAFIFAPNVDDTFAGIGMRRLLDSNLPRAARRCLVSQIGSIARRNSCGGPWSASVDMHATLRPSRLTGSDRISGAIRVVNLVGLLDEALHGSRRARGWGQATAPDPFLLTPAAFDSASRRFRYNVNPHFGRRDGPRGALVNPFVISLDVRIAIGSDPREKRFLSLIGTPRANQPPGQNAAEIKARVAGQLADPFQMLLDARDSVGLSAEQVSKVEAMQTAYLAEADEVWDKAINDLLKGNSMLDVRAGIRLINDAAIEIQRRQFRWGRAIRDSLSPTQRDAAPLFVQHVMFDNESTAEPLLR